jgi:hypothetical protein
MLAEQAFNGSSPHRKRVDIPGMFLNLILEQKENKARGKKFESAVLRASFAAVADIYFRYFRVTPPGLTFAFRAVAAVDCRA